MGKMFFVNRSEKNNFTIGQVKKDGFSISLNEEEIIIIEALIQSPKIKAIFEKCAEAGYYLNFKNVHPSTMRD